MNTSLQTFLVGLVVATGYLVYRCYNQLQVAPDTKTNTNYGLEDKKFHSDDPTVNPFVISVQRQVILDLNDVLFKSTAIADGKLSRRGMESFATYWREDYLRKWPLREMYLNRYHHFTTEINGLKIHYIHEISINQSPDTEYTQHVAILLLHGWPGAVCEFYDVIARLLAFSKSSPLKFHIVVPSLVGHGFSSTPKPGFGTHEMATVMRNLMLRLGYTRFMIHGGIWSSFIASHMSTMFPENVIALHSNMCLVKNSLTQLRAVMSSIVPRSLYYQSYKCPRYGCGTAKLYSFISTGNKVFLNYFKFDTIAHGISEDPLLLADFILDKMELHIEDIFNGQPAIDHVLDNIMIYYLTNTVLSGMQFHAESISEKQVSLPFNRMKSHAPTACIEYKTSVPLAQDSELREKYPKLLQSTKIPKKTHFPGMEDPDNMADDLLFFTRKLFL